MGRSRELAELATAYDSGSLGFRNRIINGCMRVAQRGTSFTNVDGYKLDRWVVGNPSTNSVAQLWDATMRMFVMDITTSAAWGTFQWIENLNVRDLASGSTVAVSYWCNTESGNFNIRTSNVGQTNYATTTIETRSGWFRRFAVVTIDSSQANDIASGGHLRLTIEPGVNSFKITGVQLEAGSVATPFEVRPIGTELMLCQRYYYRLTAATAFANAGTGRAYSTTNGQAVIAMPVSMRAAPTGAVSNVSHWNGAGGSITSMNPVSQYSGDFRQMTVDITSPFTSGQTVILNANNTTSAWIDWSAEL